MNKRVILLLATALLGISQISPTPTPRPNGWIVRPLGRARPVDTFPMSTVMTPDGQYLLVLSAGGEKPNIRVFAVSSERQISRLDLPDAWLGLALSPNGRLVYASGGASGMVHEMRLSPEGDLALTRSMATQDDKGPTPEDLIGDVAVTSDGRMLYAADVLHDRIAVINLSSGRIIERYPAAPRPYRIAFHPDGKSYFVTGWADGSVTQYETQSGRRRNGIQVGAHATDIAWRDKKTQLEEGEEAPWAARMFIPAANTNNVYAVAVSSSNDLRVIERVPIGLFVNQPVGMTPSAVALSPDQSRLYVACSDANALAVLDVSGVKSRLLGFIPTDEYPTAVRVLPDGRLFVLNGSGVALFLRPPAEEDLPFHSGIVMANSPLKNKETRERPIAYNPLPFSPGEPTPIDHVVYIIKDGGSSNSSEQMAPNQFKLAREFTPIGNFTANGDTPLEKLYWSTAGIVPDFVQKVGRAVRDRKPQDQRLKIDLLDLAAQPPAGYLWNQAPSRLYGISPTLRSPRGVIAAPIANTDFREPDPSVSDVDRAQVFLREFQRFDEQQNLPKLVMIRLANDRPGPAVGGQRTQQASIADNDYALGLIVERLSHSKYWPKMAIFVIGSTVPRSVSNVPFRGDVGALSGQALVISPFAVRGKAASGSYNTLSVLRSIEMILGLAPMTQFDAGATPLEAAFQSTPDLRPYDAERPRVPIDAITQ